MNSTILKFSQGLLGENSSKRLAGLLCSFVICFMAVCAAEHFISTAKDKELNDLIETLCMFAGSLLISGLAEHYMVRKNNEKDLPISSSN